MSLAFHATHISNFKGLLLESGWYFVLILCAFILGIGGRSKFSIANNTITTSCGSFPSLAFHTSLHPTTVHLQILKKSHGQIIIFLS